MLILSYMNFIATGMLIVKEKDMLSFETKMSSMKKIEYLLLVVQDNVKGAPSTSVKRSGPWMSTKGATPVLSSSSNTVTKQIGVL